MKSLITTLFFAAASTSANGAPIQWTSLAGGNDHWYDFVILDTAVSATEAESAAEASVLSGSAGYLATITSSAEQSFLNSIWTGVGSVSGQFEDASFFLIGASDRDSEGSFSWIGGPEEGDSITFENWATGEPNDVGAGEDYTVAWWKDETDGRWNDVAVGGSFKAYLVEFEAAITTVPLPFGLPLLLTALGGMGFISLRRKAS